ncbi:glycosyltransferase [Pseudazoarcus pumilus]|nr:glycosyltransferase [Pseudazoarcus pumilus]
MTLSASVIVPVLNGASTIGDTLKGVLSQVGQPERYEVIVVDNGSADGTQDIVRQYPVRLLHCATPGASAVRNVGLNACAGDIYVNADADTLPARNWLKELLRPFSDPSTVLVGGRIISFMPKTGAERYIERAGLFRPENSALNPRFAFVNAGNLAVRREAALAIGGWDETLHASEDVDFSARLVRHSRCEIRYAENAILFHRNRTDDDDLIRQAAGYGRGAARIYRRFPEETGWNFMKAMRVRRMIVSRSVRPGWLRLRRLVSRVSEEELEFARYHRMWTRAFWGAFFETWRQEGRDA